MFKFYNPPTGNAKPPSINDVACTHICFAVEDIEKAYQELIKKGVKFNSPPEVLSVERLKEKVKAAYFKDPDGITVEIVQNVPWSEV